MAASRLNRCSLNVLLWTAAACAQSAEPVVRDYQLDADTVEVDLRTGNSIMHNVKVVQDNVSITADRAEGKGQQLENDRWEFSGNVNIEAEQSGNIHSDSAVVEFRNRRIVRVTIRGAPAKFEQKRKGSAEIARGHANTIIYEVAAGTVQFAKDAWLSNGQNQISAPLLVYDMRTEKVQAPKQAGQQVRITVVPKASAKEAAAEDSSPAAAPRPSDGEPPK